MWSKAKHPNVHELMGLMMFQGHLGMVSLWMKNGNVHEYIEGHPDANRYQLVGLLRQYKPHQANFKSVHSSSSGRVIYA